MLELEVQRLRLMNTVLLLATLALLATLGTNLVEASWLSHDTILYGGAATIVSLCFLLNYLGRTLFSH